MTYGEHLSLAPSSHLHTQVNDPAYGSSLESHGRTQQVEIPEFAGSTNHGFPPSGLSTHPTGAYAATVNRPVNVEEALHLQTSQNHILQAQATELNGRCTYYREQAIRFREAYEREVALSQKLMENLLELRLRVYRRRSSRSSRPAHVSASGESSSPSGSSTSQEVQS
jgi:hypothetical protein